ncbi:short-subunit dehydrogenase [Neomicrococcus aestuarii]|uniref:Short-subunit dehydrogenase n=1 Tax=Neomicrococcus aestuarii TaxID=556325 RepID=A0A7W8TUI7_9MICC|nr:SDR family NAD(P)-dependent oxidoreductase [Neomicrococcus aestuarii]MBB5513150.1 short-subunit dehydrogenase [Neomicrococcus aestuarii]
MTTTLESARGLTVLITGAALGMGRIYAQKAVLEGAKRVVLWDVNAENLEQAATELRTLAKDSTHETVIEPQVVDVSQASVVVLAAQEVLANGTPDILINNAGIVRGKPFAEHTHQDIELTMNINASAPMHITLEFLAAMNQGTQQRRIMNIASAAAFVSNPRMSVYAASKAAALGWSDTLRLELQAERSNIAVTTICPLYTSTGMFDGAQPVKLTKLLTPEAVTGAAWTAMLKGTPLVVIPKLTNAARTLRGALPTPAWDYLAEHAFGIYSTMRAFRGRN